MQTKNTNHSADELLAWFPGSSLQLHGEEPGNKEGLLHAHSTYVHMVPSYYMLLVMGLALGQMQSMYMKFVLV